MKRLIAYFVSGVRTGSFFYLAFLLLGQLFPQLIYPKVNVGNILALFMMSGLMGMLSWILEELDRMSYRFRVILHFLLTAIVLTVTCLISGWYEALTNPAIWIVFIFVYINFFNAEVSDAIPLHSRFSNFNFTAKDKTRF